MEVNEKDEFYKHISSSIEKREEMTLEIMKKADEIQYKNIPDKVLKTDKFGFIKKSEEIKAEDIQLDKKELKKENARIEKWSIILEDYDKYLQKNYEKLKSRVRKGIPDCFRGIVWQLLAETSIYKDDPSHKSTYKDLKAIPDSNNENEQVILRDIDRTFPKHYLFADRYGMGQRSLYNVLRAYSIFNKQTGYVQGMGFITALFLTYMDEESAFWMIHALMKKYCMQGNYVNNFPELQKSFFILLSLLCKLMPKVYEELKKNNIIPSMFASNWMMTLFSSNFDFKILVRIFDLFFCEGVKIKYRIALGIFKINEEKIIGAKSFEKLMTVLSKNLHHDIQIEDLFAKAFKFSISRKQISDLEKIYEMNTFTCEEEYFKVIK